MDEEEYETKLDTEYDPSLLTAAVSKTPKIDEKEEKRKLVEGKLYLNNEIFRILLEKGSRKKLKALIRTEELSQDDYDTIERVLGNFYIRCDGYKGVQSRSSFGDHYCDPRQKAIIIGNYMTYGQQGINTCTTEQTKWLHELGVSLIEEGIALDEDA